MRLNPVTSVPVATASAAVTLAAATNVAEVFYAKDELDAGDAGYGALAAAWGVGMVVGALGIGRRLTGSTAALAVATGTLVTGFSLISAAVAGTLALAIAIFVAGGAANGTENVAMRTLIHARVEDGLWGRAYAAYHGAMTAAEFTAYAIGGLLVEATGPRETMAIAGAGALLAGLAGARRLLR
jgi:MFS family permease